MHRQQLLKLAWPDLFSCMSTQELQAMQPSTNSRVFAKVTESTHVSVISPMNMADMASLALLEQGLTSGALYEP